MLYVLHGSDELALRRRLQALRDAADGGSGMLTTNLTVIEGRDATAAAILQAAMAFPFLAPRRLVIVERLLDRFAQSEGRTSSRSSVEAFEPLVAALTSDALPPTTDLVITGLSPGQRNPLLAKLKEVPGASVEELRPPERDDLLRFIRTEATARGVRFKTGQSRRPLEPGDEWLRPAERDPAALLAARFGSDTLALANELDKLAASTLGAEATVDDVDLVCGGERDATVFQFLDAVMDGDLKGAFRTLDYLLREGESRQGILAMTANAYRRLATILDLLEDGASPEEIGKAINLPWEGLRNRAIARAHRLSAGSLVKAYELIVEADRRTKLGEIDEDLAIEVLLLRLAALAPAPDSGATARATRH